MTNVGEPTVRYSQPPSVKNELPSAGDMEAEPEENLSKVLGMSRDSQDEPILPVFLEH